MYLGMSQALQSKLFMSKETKAVLARIIFDLSLLIGVFFLPWWLTFSAAIAGVISFSWFWEIVVIALFIESIFATGWFPELFLSAVAVLLITEGFVHYISRP